MVPGPPPAVAMRTGSCSLPSPPVLVRFAIASVWPKRHIKRRVGGKTTLSHGCLAAMQTGPDTTPQAVNKVLTGRSNWYHKGKSP